MDKKNPTLQTRQIMQNEPFRESQTLVCVEHVLCSGILRGERLKIEKLVDKIILTKSLDRGLEFGLPDPYARGGRFVLLIEK